MRSARHMAAGLLGAGLLGLTAGPVLAQKNPLREAYYGANYEVVPTPANLADLGQERSPF